MGKKLIVGMILLLLFCVSGCAAFSRESTVPPAQTEIPKDTEIIEGMKTGKAPAGEAVGEQNEDILELKHWKYGSERAQPPAQPSAQQSPGQPEAPQPPELPVMDEPASDNWEAVSIQILSQEELVQIMKRLVELGYLKEPVSELEFQAAIRDFQRDNSLPITGKLDGSTRELLRGQ